MEASRNQRGPRTLAPVIEAIVKDNTVAVEANIDRETGEPLKDASWLLSPVEPATAAET